jgi:hypothetical protein
VRPESSEAPRSSPPRGANTYQLRSAFGAVSPNYFQNRNQTAPTKAGGTACGAGQTKGRKRGLFPVGAPRFELGTSSPPAGAG